MTIRIALVIIFVAFSGYFFGARPSVAFAADSIAQRSKNSNGHGFQRNVRFSGEVLKGRSFERQVGANLFFRLVPEELGWSISMGNKAPRENFCSVVTPPYRGMNALRIEGWHFRNADNTGPNDGGVNAPRELREFIFSPAVGRDVEFNGSATTAGDVEKVQGFGRGWFFIESYRLTPPQRGERASFETITFSACVTWPAG